MGNNEMMRFEPGLKLATHKELGEYLKGGLVFPISVEVSPSGVCDAKCPKCFYSQNSWALSGRDKEFFKESRMEGLINEFAGIGVKSISWSVRGNERVPLFLKDGGFELIEIKNLNNSFNKSISENKGKISKNLIEGVFSHKANNKLLKITTRGGYNLTLTPNHSAMIFKNGIMNNVLAKELKIGDLFSTPKKIPFGKCNKKISKEFARLLGYFVAEGSFGDYYITFSLGVNNFEQKIIKDIQNISKKLGHNCSIHKLKNKTKVYIFGGVLEKQFRLLIENGSRNKNIPHLIFNSNKEIAEEFLFGLYAGDGCLRIGDNSRCILNLKTASKRLAEEIIVLWRMLEELPSYLEGINAERVIEGRILPKTNYYSIDLSGYRIDKFKFIRKLAKWKNKKIKSKGTKYSFVQNKSKIVKQEFNDLYLLEIVKIEQIENSLNEEVYDIQIKENHNFFCGTGLLETHNTGGGEPTLHPSFHKFVELANWGGLEQGLFTNALKPIKYDPTLFEWIRVTKTNYNLNEKILEELRPCKTLGICINYSKGDSEKIIENALGIAERLDSLKISKDHSTYVQVRPALEIKGGKVEVEVPLIKHPLLTVTDYKFLGSNIEREYDVCEAYHFTPFIWQNGDVDVCAYHKGNPEFNLGNLYLKGKQGRFKYIMENAPKNIKVVDDCQICCKLNSMNSMIYHMKKLKDVNFP